MSLVHPRPKDPVVEAYKRDVDRTLIRANLKLTVTQRFQRLMERLSSEETACAGSASARNEVVPMNALTDVNWCCPSFRGLVRDAGSRGFGIFVDDNSEPPLFVLQYRSIEPGAPWPAYEHGALGLVGHIGILNCPWCGKALRTWYRNDIHRLYRPELATELSHPD
jgi:hypothetical protein